jgi:hypothetical protein
MPSCFYKYALPNSPGTGYPHNVPVFSPDACSVVRQVSFFPNNCWFIIHNHPSIALSSDAVQPLLLMLTPWGGSVSKKKHCCSASFIEFEGSFPGSQNPRLSPFLFHLNPVYALKPSFFQMYSNIRGPSPWGFKIKCYINILSPPCMLHVCHSFIFYFFTS